MLTTPMWSPGVLALAKPRVLPPNPFHVNTVTGTASGSGTLLSPNNSLAAAIIACAGLPDYTITVVAPESAPVRQEINYESSMALTISGLSGAKWYAYGSDVVSNTWVGSGPVYSKTLNYTLLTQVVVTTLTELVGDRTFYRKLLQNTTTPTTPSAGEFGYAGGVLYVRMWDSGSPASHTFEIARRNTCLGTKGFGLLTINDVVARHALVNGINNGQAGQPLGTGKLHVNNSITEYCVNGGVGAAGQNEETICTYVESYRIANDGFNHHATSGGQYMELRGCKGSYCGDKAGQSAQGASNHENTILVIKGGEFNYNVSGGLVAIETSKATLIGDSEYGKVTISKNMRLGNTAGAVSSQASCAWLDTSIGSVIGPVEVTDGLGVGVRRSSGATLTGYSNITSSGNALPDIV